MEHEREPQQQQQEQPPQTPFQCPRCGSLNTRFRYYNNNSRAQPRHYCMGCEQLWTVGGNIRNIPTKCKAKTKKASFSKGGNPISKPPQPWLSLGEEHQNSQSPTMVSQNFDATTSQPVTNFPVPVSQLEPYSFNDEISCMDAIQSLIQPEITIQHVNAENHIINAGAKVTVPQEQNVQTIAPQRAMWREIPRNMESHQPVWPMNSLSHDITNGLSFTTADAGLWNNFIGETDTEDTTSVNIDDWLNFPGDNPH